jgi:hypothetical protein
MEWQSSLRQELEGSNGPMSSAIDISTITSHAGKETASLGVRNSLNLLDCPCWRVYRFMTDKIMPMSQALEGYELFNGMKVQKVIFEAQK